MIKISEYSHCDSFLIFETMLKEMSHIRSRDGTRILDGRVGDKWRANESGEWGLWTRFRAPGGVQCKVPVEVRGGGGPGGASITGSSEFLVYMYG